MRHSGLVGLAGLAALASAAGAAAAGTPTPKGELYPLAKTPVFRPGDRLTCKTTETARLVAALKADARIVRNTTTNRSDQLVLEVLEADAAGAVQAFRVGIVQATQGGKSLEPKSDDGRSVRIAGLHFTVRREDGAFRADTTSVAAEKAGEPRASQLFLLKSYLANPAGLGEAWTARGCPVPEEPVAVGRRWEPSRRELEAMFGGPLADDRGERPTYETLARLTGVADGVASVRFALRLRKGTVGSLTSLSIDATSRIDTRTGIEVGLEQSSELHSELGELAFKTESRRQRELAFQPGGGKATPLPEGLHDLGWKPPDKDTNPYRNDAFGFSLAPPAGYAADRGDLPPGQAARFLCDKPGHTILVGYEEGVGPLDLEDVAPNIKKEIRASIPDFKLTEERKLTLVDHVPACLIAGTAFEGKASKQVLAVLDGGRLFTLVATCKADSAEDKQQALDAMLTFRLLPPAPARQMGPDVPPPRP